jgi:hypothetical protein
MLAAYLKAQGKPPAEAKPSRVARHASQAKSSETTAGEVNEDIPRPPADIPDTSR